MHKDRLGLIPGRKLLGRKVCVDIQHVCVSTGRLVSVEMKLVCYCTVHCVSMHMCV